LAAKNLDFGTDFSSKCNGSIFLIQS